MPRVAPIQPCRGGRTSPAPRATKRQEPRLVDDTPGRRGHRAGTAQMVIEQVVISNGACGSCAGGNGDGLPRQHKRGTEGTAPFPLHVGEGGIGDCSIQFNGRALAVGNTKVNYLF